MISRKYIYVDGHVVRNSPKYVIPWKSGTILTEWANAHVDACCLRFVREYVQTQLGTYTFGKMYYDAEYVKRTLFFLDDMINKRHLNEYDRKHQALDHILRVLWDREIDEAKRFLESMNLDPLKY